VLVQIGTEVPIVHLKANQSLPIGQQGYPKLGAHKGKHLRARERQSDIQNQKYLSRRNVRKLLRAPHHPTGAGGAEHRPSRSATT